MASTYKIRKSHTTSRTDGSKYPQFTLTLPIEIAGPLHAAGCRVRYEVRDDCIAIIPVPVETGVSDSETHNRVVSLVDRFITSGQEG